MARRLPDGEVQGWNTYPAATLAKATGLEESGRTARAQPEMPPYPLWRMKPGTRPEDIRFAPVGYDRIASASYAEFLAARREGAVAPGTRFQVSLPTPFATIGSRVVPPVGTGSLSNGSVSSLNDTLDAYNNGEIGPGHCDDSTSAASGKGKKGKRN